MKSLEFVINGVIRKVFATKSNEVVNDCLLFFDCEASDAIYNRKLRYLSKLKYSNVFISYEVSYPLLSSIMLVTIPSLLLFFLVVLRD